MRARRRLWPPDALQMATCLVEGGSAFVTNDERLRSIEDPEIIIMKDYL
jgi:predicted nucleic acid-binding protein